MATTTGRMSQFSQPQWATGTLTGNYTNTFTLNNLPSHEYETLPLSNGHIPGYTGHVPGSTTAFAQRKAQASLHTINHISTFGTSRTGQQQDMTLVDLRPEQRSMNKVYMYAEDAQSNFLRFPTKKTFDHRKL